MRTPQPGLHTITVYVTDKDGFTGWATYEQEAFAFGGFKFPLRDVKPWFRAPAGSTVPVAFNLGTDFGMSVLMPGYPQGERLRLHGKVGVRRSGC